MYKYTNSMENYQKVRPDNRLKLLDQVCDVIRKKHYSIRTEYVYVNWIQEITLCSFSKKSTGILNTQVQDSPQVKSPSGSRKREFHGARVQG